MDIIKKASYIKGLLAGLNIDINTTEGKVLNAIVGFLENVSDEVDSCKKEIDDLWDIIDNLSKTLDGNIDEHALRYFCVKCPECNRVFHLDYYDFNNEELDGEINCPICNSKININDCFIFDDYKNMCDCGCKRYDCDCNDQDCDSKK